MQNKKTVFLFLGLRAYISDLLQTNYIRYLSEKYDVVVFLSGDLEGVRDPNTAYFKTDSITYITLPLPKSRFWMFFDVFARTEFIRVFDDNIAVKWRNSRARDRRRLILRALARCVPKRLTTPKHFLTLETFFVPGFKEFKEYVKKYNPLLVLTATPGLQPFDTYAILCARKAGIPSVAVNFSWDNLTSTPRHVRKTNYAIAWNEWIKEQALKWHGYADNEVLVSGTPRFDHYFIDSPLETDRKTFLESKGLDPRYKTVFSTARTYSTFSLDFIRAFLKWRKEDVFGEPLNLFIRVHPLDSMTDYAEFQGEPHVRIEYGSKDVKQDPNSGGQKVEMNERDLVNMKQTLKYCDVQVTIASTVSIEGCVFDMPVINSGFAGEFSIILNFLHYRPVVEAGAVKVAKDMDEVKDFLMMYLKDPSIDREGRKKIVDMLIKPTDGFSYKRSVDFLDDIIEREYESR